VVRIRDGVQFLAEGSRVGPNYLRTDSCGLTGARRSASDDTSEKDRGVARRDTEPPRIRGKKGVKAHGHEEDWKVRKGMGTAEII